MTRKSTTRGGATGPRKPGAGRKSAPRRAGAKPATENVVEPDAKDTALPEQDSADTVSGGAQSEPVTSESTVPDGQDSLAAADGPSTTSEAERPTPDPVPGADASDPSFPTDAAAEARPDSSDPAQGSPVATEAPDTGSAASDTPADATPEAASADKAGVSSADETTDAERDDPPAAVAGAAALAATGIAPEPEADRKRSDPPPPPPRNGFVPLVLGGIIAGGIGFGAHYLLSADDPAPDTSAELTALQGEIDSLRADMDGLPPPTDLAAVEDEIASLRSDLDALRDLSGVDEELEQLRAALQAEDGPDLAPLEERIDALAAQRAEIMAEQDDALSSLRGELDELRAEMADLRDLSERRVAEAEAAVDTALARAGLESMQAALRSGAPYPDAITQLEQGGVDVPQALAGPASTGVPTLETLQDDFPAAARAALRETLQTAPADSTTERLGNFLRAQVGARSTAPREGDSADAILSRAGAHVEAGDLSAALDEIADLPQQAQDSLSGWTSGAEARLAADAALPDLTDSISTE